jgi:hypothetical protein
MKISIERDVGKVANFMLRNVDARELRRVAHAITQIADMFWTEECFNQPLNSVRSFRLDFAEPMDICQDQSAQSPSDTNELV